MVNIDKLVDDGRELFQELEQTPGLTIDGAFWINIQEPQPPRLKFVVRELPKLGPTKIYGAIQRLLRNSPKESFTLEDVAIVDDDDTDVRSMRSSLVGNSPILSRTLRNVPNTGGATAYVYRLAPQIKKKRSSS